MNELTSSEIEDVVGGESESTHRELAEGIIVAGIVTGNPLIFGLGVLYAATD